MTAITLALRIHIPTLSAIAFVTAAQPSDLSTLRSMFSDPLNIRLLRTSPMGLLPLVLEQRSYLWEEWVASLFKSLNEIEAHNELSPPEWICHIPVGQRAEELKDGDHLLSELSKMHVEIGHGTNVLTDGIRFGQVCKQAVEVLHSSSSSSQGNDGEGGEADLRPGEIELLLQRIRGPLSLCQSVKGRFEEMGRRHRGHQNQVTLADVI